MVLIEPVTSSEEISERKPLVVKAAEASADGVSSTASGGAVAASGYCSDGYETASETEHNDSDEAEGKEDEHIHSHSGITEENVKKDNTNRATKLSTSAGHEEGQKHETEPDMDKLNETAIALANDLKLEGNSLFRDGLHEEALSKYELALQAARNAPMSTEIQSICHANRASCFSKLGNHAETIKECTKALELNPTYLKVLLRRAEAHEKLDHYDEAIKDMKSILELEPSHDQARRALVRLKPLADEKHEKMKEEMIGKLKEMGNSILGRFGMSVDNFKAVKDPNTGSYSISFQQ